MDAAPGAVADFAALGRGGRAAWWRYLAGFVFIVGGFVLLGALIFGFGPDLDAVAGDPWLAQYLALNVPFLPLIPLILLVVWAWHGRSPRSIATAAPRFGWGRAAIAFAACGAPLLAVSLLVGDDTAPADNGAAWMLRILPFLVLFTPIQAAAEEILFRGYLLQATASFTRSRMVILAVNAALFAAVHGINPEALANPVAALLGFAIWGAGLAWIALRDRGLELVIGAHVANNLVSFAVAGYLRLPFDARAEHYEPLVHYASSIGILIILAAIIALRPRRD